MHVILAHALRPLLSNQCNELHLWSTAKTVVTPRPQAPWVSHP